LDEAVELHICREILLQRKIYVWLIRIDSSLSMPKQAQVTKSTSYQNNQFEEVSVVERVVGISSGAFINDLTMPPRKDTSNDNAPTSFQDQLSALNAKVDALVNSMTNLLQPPAAAAAALPPPNKPLHKSPKIMLPTFDGTCPLDWLFQADQYFTFYNIPVDQRVALASFHFQGDALSWYKYMHNNGLLGD
ncbi:hypothetical protein Tco_1438606, partial [Tanacetum coccineum]